MTVPLKKTVYSGMSVRPCRSVEHLAGALVRDLTIGDDRPAVHKQVFHSGGVLVGRIEGGRSRNRRCVENHHVRLHSGSQQAAVVQSGTAGGERSHPAHGVLERQHTAFADIPAEDPGEGAIAAGMRGSLSELRYLAIGGDHGERVSQDPFQILLLNGMVYRLAAAALLDFDGGLDRAFEFRHGRAAG